MDNRKEGDIEGNIYKNSFIDFITDKTPLTKNTIHIENSMNC